MVQIIKPLILFCTAACLCGCITLGQDRRNAEMRDRAQVANLRATVQRLEERVEGLATTQQDLYREVDAVRTQLRSNGDDAAARLDRVETSLKSADAAHEQLRKEIVDDITGKMAGMMKQRSASGGGSRNGYEHVVQPGQTLSEIAPAYKSTVAAIVRANKLSSPDNIRVGQTLFIPE